MRDVYTMTKDGGLIKAASGLTKGGAKLFIDALMASARPDDRPKVTVYSFGKFAYSRSF